MIFAVRALGRPQRLAGPRRHAGRGSSGRAARAPSRSARPSAWNSSRPSTSGSCSSAVPAAKTPPASWGSIPAHSIASASKWGCESRELLHLQICKVLSDRANCIANKSLEADSYATSLSLPISKTRTSTYDGLATAAARQSLSTIAGTAKVKTLQTKVIDRVVADAGDPRGARPLGDRDVLSSGRQHRCHLARKLYEHPGGRGNEGSDRADGLGASVRGRGTSRSTAATSSMRIAPGSRQT